MAKDLVNALAVGTDQLKELKLVATALTAKPMQRGLKMVCGVPAEVKPIVGAPAGKCRLRLRAKDVAKLFVKTATGIRSFILEDKGDSWLVRGDLHQGGNERHLRRRAWLPGADISKFKTFNIA